MLSYEQGLPLALRLTVHSNSTSLIKVAGFTKDAVFSFEMTPVGDLTQEVQIFSLTDFPIWLSIVTDDDTIERGDVYAKVELMIRNTPHGTLAQGYVASLETPTWPNGVSEGSLNGRGKFRVVTGSNPAAGSEISETVPANLHWILHAMVVTLVTDANVSSRRVHLLIDFGGGSAALNSVAGNTQSASITRQYNIAHYGQTSIGGVDNDTFIGIPTSPHLIPGSIISTETDALEVGDDFGAPLLFVEQFIAP